MGGGALWWLEVGESGWRCVYRVEVEMGGGG